MSKREKRILIGILLLMVLVIAGGLFVANLQSSATVPRLDMTAQMQTLDAAAIATAKANNP